MRRAGEGDLSRSAVQESDPQYGGGRVSRGQGGGDLCHTGHGLTRGRGGEKSVIRFEKFLKTFHLNIK